MDLRSRIMKSVGTTSTHGVLICILYLTGLIFPANSIIPCNVCVSVAYEEKLWQQAYNKSEVRRFWQTLFSDVELKLQITVHNLDVKIEFRSMLSINEIREPLPNPEIDEREYMVAISKNLEFSDSVPWPCVNILFIETTSPTNYTLISSKRLVSFQTSVPRHPYRVNPLGFRVDLEQDILHALGFDVEDHKMVDQFNAQPLDVWKWEGIGNVCSRSTDFPENLHTDIPHANAAELCNYWHEGTLPETKDICGKIECTVNRTKFPIYPSYNVPCGLDSICVQGKCLPAGIKIELNKGGMCIEAEPIKQSVRVTAKRCMRGSYQAQTFMLGPVNDDGFYVQTRTFDDTFSQQCLTVETNRIVVKDCKTKLDSFVWRFLYSLNDTGYLMHHVVSKSFVTVQLDGKLELSPYCNLTKESQRWRIYQVEGNRSMDTSKIDPRKDFPWLFDKELCRSSANSQHTDFSDDPSSPPGGLKLLSFNVLGSCAIVVLCIVLATTVCLWVRFKRRTANLMQHFNERFYIGDIDKMDKDKWLNDQVECIPFNKEWEFPVENIIIGESLGSGAFGSVMKGTANGILHKNVVTDIAIKMCRSRGNIRQIEILASEMKILAFLGPHTNIVRILGVCAKQQNLMVLLEYCPNGSLKQFLVNNRDFYDANSGGPKYEREFLGYTILHEPAQPEEQSCIIRRHDLYRWAAEIAAGMSYIVENRVLHGDLAARNVLLGKGLTAKICDFGLSKKLLRSYNYKYNKLSASTLLPLKWMAIESIQLGVFSSQSDVWSYGVLLWELFSLGTIPYAGFVMDNNLVDRIHAGLRLEKPPYSPDNVYKTMLGCWSKDPSRRPTFSDLQSVFGESYENESLNCKANSRTVVMLGSNEVSGSDI